MEMLPTSNTDVPMSSDNFVRAVFRAAPSRFSIEFLPPTRQGGTSSHGMRISKILKGDRSSISSHGSQSEYDIWRRWEDCLWLQDTLEQEYSRAARERRTRLAQGKGVKDFNGIYKQDLASSWESLPPGPAPQSVARDVHQYIPHLTKKGTFFRPKPALVEHRQQEFQTLIEALMGDNMPALVKEIRSSRVITDFFGFWRSDFELEERHRKAHTPRTSITSSVLSSYFSSSHPTLHSPQSLRSSTRSKATLSTTSERPFSVASDTIEKPSSPLRSIIESMDTLTKSNCPTRHRSISETSSSPSSSHSDEMSDSPNAISAPAPQIAPEQPVKFGHNPHRAQNPASPVSESLSEDTELYVMSSLGGGGLKSVHLRRRPMTTAGDRRLNRNCQVFSSPVASPDLSQTQFDVRSLIRESWQSGVSADMFLEGLGIALPTSPKERISVASISTFMTTDSAEAILPPTPMSPYPRDGDGDCKFRTPRNSLPVSLSDFDIVSENGEGGLSILDSSPRPMSYIPEIDSRPNTPVGQSDIGPSPRRAPQDLPRLIIHTNDTYTPPSPTSSTFSTSTAQTQTSSMLLSDSVSIKAAYNSSIIMLKVSRDIPYNDLRQRLYNKFVGQEGVPLSHSFTILVPQFGNAQPFPPALDESQGLCIDSHLEWNKLTTSFNGTKLTLRILDATS